MTHYRHTADMPPIMPGDEAAEAICQDMLETGVNWLKSHPEADIRFERYQDVVGLFYSDTHDAQELLSTIIHAAHKECTGAQIHAVVERLGFIAMHGWDAYCAQVRTGQPMTQLPAETRNGPETGN